jgi:hypothetical protein
MITGKSCYSMGHAMVVENSDIKKLFVEAKAGVIKVKEIQWQGQVRRMQKQCEK